MKKKQFKAFLQVSCCCYPTKYYWYLDFRHDQDDNINILRTHICSNPFDYLEEARRAGIKFAKKYGIKLLNECL